MRDYFKRLRHHPGLETATILSLMMFLAVASNDTVTTWQQVVIGGSVASSFIWMIVLISNRK